jgi:hypothetical protein
MDDVFQLPQEMDPALKLLYNQLLEAVMSHALRDPDGSRAETLAVVDRLAANLREHWGPE